jgi:hypothetical protein
VNAVGFFVAAGVLFFTQKRTFFGFAFAHSLILGHFLSIDDIFDDRTLIFFACSPIIYCAA